MSEERREGAATLCCRPLLFADEVRAYKPDSVRLSWRDGHFSALSVAAEVVHLVAKMHCDQPERFAGRINAFCLVLHRTEVTLTPRVTTKPVRSYRTFSPLL